MKPPVGAQLAGLILISLTCLPQILAQTPAGSPPSAKFEVASIKPGNPSAARGGRLSPPPINTSPGLLTARNANLKQLIRSAWSLENYQISGGPEWVDSIGFDVDARAADGAGRDQLLLMLRTVLADRFKMTFHREKKDLPVWAMTVAKGGPKFHASKPEADTGPSKTNRLPLKDMPSLAALLTRMSPEQPVIDQTGLTGQFDLELDMEGIAVEAMQSAGGPNLQNMFDATLNFLRDELGLKVAQTKAAVEIFVIDHAEKPTAN